MNARAVSVVVPVYNAFQEALECLETVLAYTPEAKQVLVIDDASPEGSFADFVGARLKTDQRLTIQRNLKNLGFVGSCNLAFEHLKDQDVLLLNSDTLVTPNWLAKLRQAAYSAAEVATVTALSNNAVICSVPRFCQKNIIPANLTLNEFAALVEKVSQRVYPELPTCMGFCVYVRRSALEKVGYFDAELFGRGYGEENDFSQRAINVGLKNICDDATYVYHKGNCSFLSDQVELEKRNWTALIRKHPHFADTISRFCRENPLRNMQRRIQDALLASRGELPRILHILHNGPYADRYGAPGGTELQVQSLIEQLDEYQHFSLVKGRNVYHLSAHFKGGEREFMLPVQPEKLREIIKPEFFSLVHLHHSRWFDFFDLQTALLEHGNYVVSVHDYSLICPQFYLYTLKKKACTGFECERDCGHKESYIAKLRKASVELLNSAQQIICFSESTRENFMRITPNQGKWTVIPHGLSYSATTKLASSAQPAFPGPLIKLAFVGYIPDHKGRRLVEQLQEIGELAGVKLEWHLFGKLFGRKSLQLVDHGEYQRTEIVRLLSYTRPDLVLILSECPESYSLTLDEAWAAGIPVISTPLGAPAERVKATGAGWVLDELSVAAVERCITAILSNPDKYQQVRQRVLALELPNFVEQTHKYGQLYRSYLPSRSVAALVGVAGHFKALELDSIPRISGLIGLLGKFTNKAIFILDSLKLRWLIQQAAYRFLPANWLERLKAAR